MFKSLEGQRVPQVTFRVREGENWKNVSTDDLFAKKNVIVFSLPGAFTPTCSTSHLPRYNELAETFKKQGVDSILCVSVNDTFVMNAWAKDQKSQHVNMVPDGNGEFTQKMGLLVSKEGIGFGKRSWRYSMYVSDGIIKKMFIEPEKEGDPYEVSDADTMLSYLQPNAKNIESIAMITKDGCPHCVRAKTLLNEHHLPFEEIVVDQHIPARSLRAISGEVRVPQIFIGGKRIGGADELAQYLKQQ